MIYLVAMLVVLSVNYAFLVPSTCVMGISPYVSLRSYFPTLLISTKFGKLTDSKNSQMNEFRLMPLHYNPCFA